MWYFFNPHKIPGRLYYFCPLYGETAEVTEDQESNSLSWSLFSYSLRFCHPHVGIMGSFHKSWSEWKDLSLNPGLDLECPFPLQGKTIQRLFPTVCLCHPSVLKCPGRLWSLLSTQTALDQASCHSLATSDAPPELDALDFSAKCKTSPSGPPQLSPPHSSPSCEELCPVFTCT